MRKSIVAKIMSIFLLLLVVYIVGSNLNMSNAGKISENVKDLEEVFVQIRVEQKDLVSSIETVKMYCNMIATSSSKSSADRMAGNMAGEITLLNERIASLETLCGKIWNKEVGNAFDVYHEKIDVLANIGETVVKCYNAGDMEGAVAAQSGMYGASMGMDEAYNSFETLLVATQEECSGAIDAAIKNMQSVVILMAIVFVVGVAFGGVYIYLSIVKPIKNGNKILTDIIDKIGREEGDLTVRVPVKQKDEIGQLLQGMNGFLDVLQRIMISIRGGAGQMYVSTEEINTKVVQCKDETDSVSSTMQELSASMEEVSATMQSLEEGSGHVLQSAKDMGSEVTATVQLVEQLASRADEISHNSTENQKQTEHMVSDIQQRMNVAIEASKSVDRINQLTTDILNISSQTNLLALNASIEAARAGEAGRGFAVVADEIRELADSSRDTANSIQEISGMVTNAVHDLVENAAEIMEYVTENVMKDYDGFVVSADNYKADAARLKEVFDVFEQKAAELQGIAQGMSTGIGEINSAVAESTQSVVFVTESTADMLGNMENIVAGVEENRTVANTLNEEVSRFKKLEE